MGFELHERRLLALEVRPRRLGFAVLEGVATLLNWGVRSYRAESGTRVATAARAVERLMALYAPQTLVLRKRKILSTNSRKRTVLIERQIKLVAARRSVQMHFVDPAVIHHFFSEHDAKTKYKIATALSEWFEELSWKLPPERRVWQSERYSMVIKVPCLAQSITRATASTMVIQASMIQASMNQANLWLQADPVRRRPGISAQTYGHSLAAPELLTCRRMRCRHTVLSRAACW